MRRAGPGPAEGSRRAGAGRFSSAWPCTPVAFAALFFRWLLSESGRAWRARGRLGSFPARFSPCGRPSAESCLGWAFSSIWWRGRPRGWEAVLRRGAALTDSGRIRPKPAAGPAGPRPAPMGRGLCPAAGPAGAGGRWLGQGWRPPSGRGGSEFPLGGSRYGAGRSCPPPPPPRLCRHAWVPAWLFLAWSVVAWRCVVSSASF